MFTIETLKDCEKSLQCWQLGCENNHLFRSSLEVFLEKGVLEIWGDFTGKHKCLCVISPTFLLLTLKLVQVTDQQSITEKKHQFSFMKLFKGFLNCS